MGAGKFLFDVVCFDMILKALIHGVLVFAKVTLVSNTVMLFFGVYLYHLLTHCSVLTEVTMKFDSFMENPHMGINAIFV